MKQKEISSKSSGVSYGDNAQGSITITGGVQGDFVMGGKHRAQGDRAVIVENASGQIKTGDKIHHHHYAQRTVWFAVALIAAISIGVFLYRHFHGGADIYRL